MVGRYADNWWVQLLGEGDLEDLLKKNLKVEVSTISYGDSESRGIRTEVKLFYDGHLISESEDLCLI